jgi:hypothetical protein
MGDFGGLETPFDKGFPPFRTICPTLLSYFGEESGGRK